MASSRTNQRPPADPRSTDGRNPQSRRVISGLQSPLNDIIGTLNEVDVTPSGDVLKVSISASFLALNIIPTTGEISVTDNGDGSVTVGLDPSIVSLKEKFSVPFFMGRVY